MVSEVDERIALLTGAGDAAGRLIREGVLAGCALAAVLVVITLLRYPGNADTSARYLVYGAAGLGCAIAVAGWVVWQTRRPAGVTALFVRRWGAGVGAVLGLAWVVEISFNNFVPPAISVGQSRFLVDNGIWAAIILATIVLAAVGAAASGRIATGIWLGLWSGLISGLFACLMGLLLVVFWMPFLLRDPYNLDEWTARGAASGAPDLPTYLAYETLAGAFGHLVALGIVFGILLGALGGTLGLGINKLRRQAHPTRQLQS